MEYPEEIYATRDGGLLTSNAGAGWGRRHAYNIGCARGYQSGYEAGKAEQADSLEGFSNLTEAIKAGEPIDWERLDGLKAQCVQPGSGSLSGKLVRDDCWLANSGSGWKVHGMGADYLTVTAWYGEDGWSLWIEGDIPLVRKTADQLKTGTYFLGESEWELYVGEKIDGSKIVRHVPKMEESLFDPSEWVVLEEYGTFQKPEDK